MTKKTNAKNPTKSTNIKHNWTKNTSLYSTTIDMSDNQTGILIVASRSCNRRKKHVSQDLSYNTIAVEREEKLKNFQPSHNYCVPAENKVPLLLRYIRSREPSTLKKYDHLLTDTVSNITFLLIIHFHRVVKYLESLQLCDFVSFSKCTIRVMAQQSQWFIP